MTKEEFNNIWKDTSREGILNQFYYDYMYMKKLKEDINKAIEIIESYNLGKYDYSIPPGGISDLLETLIGGENNR